MYNTGTSLDRRGPDLTTQESLSAARRGRIASRPFKYLMSCKKYTTYYTRVPIWYSRRMVLMFFSVPSSLVSNGDSVVGQRCVGGHRFVGPRGIALVEERLFDTMGS